MADSCKPVFRKPVPNGVVEHLGVGAGSATAVVEVEDGLMMIAGRRVLSIRRWGADLARIRGSGLDDPRRTDLSVVHPLAVRQSGAGASGQE